MFVKLCNKMTRIYKKIKDLLGFITIFNTFFKIISLLNYNVIKMLSKCLYFTE
jgi:hypothetical protein